MGRIHGRFEPVARVEVRPRVSGYITEVHFTDGAIVKEGDLLFTIDRRPFEFAVASAQADVARTKALVRWTKPTTSGRNNW